MSRFALGSVAVVLVLTAGCTLPEAPAATVGTNAEAAHGKPYPTQAPKVATAPTLDIVAQIDPVWEQPALTAKAGVVNISFTGPPQSNHNLNLVGPRAPYALVWGEAAGAPEDHLTYAVTLFPGTYTFFCSVQGHRAAGMEGTIVVS